jgi:F-type H+-transporting ATPase subunit delta
MVRIDTPPDAIDKAYAKSLFELADEKGGRERLESVSAELEELVEIVRANPRFEEFIASRIIPAEAKSASLRKILGGNVDDLILHTTLVLNKKGRADRFARMAAAFGQMVEERFGRVEVDVYTRFAIPPDQLESLRSILQQKLDREPVIYTYTDPTMIGGLKIRVGDQLLDASFANRLRKMRDLLKEEGGALIRERFDNAFEN